MSLFQSLFSLEIILSLPWIVKGPGLLVMGLFIYRFVKAILMVRPVSALAALFWVFAAGVVLTRFGRDFARLFMSWIS